MTTYFTADHHFSHKNIIRLCNRPFSSLEEMEESLIERWNSVVKDGDTVYHLGDFYTQDKKSGCQKYLSQLKGNIFMMKGNHDYWMDDKGFFPIPKKGNAYFISPQYEINIEGKMIVLSHYSMRTWNKSFHGSWSLFGHSHGMLPPHGLSFDVGVDCWNFTPVSFEQICDKMSILTKFGA